MGGRGRPKGTGPTKDNKRNWTKKANASNAANAAAGPRAGAPAKVPSTTVATVCFADREWQDQSSQENSQCKPKPINYDEYDTEVRTVSYCFVGDDMLTCGPL